MPAPRRRSSLPVASASAYGFATTVVAGAALVAYALRGVLPVASLALVFVCAVLAVALRTRQAVAVYSAVISSLAYNFFFTEPRWSLRIQSPSDLLAVLTFFVAALAVGHLAGRHRDQVARLEGARVEAETERLRTALLSSVSHDLRSPLAAVIGSATSLAAYGDAMPEGDRRELLESIRSEAERLDRYIQNLLDMTRLGSGPLKLERDWVALEEILASAAARLAKLHSATEVLIEIAPGLPPLHVHAALVEQALFNVLENAAKFSPPGEPIAVRAWRNGDRLAVDVVDRGPGVPAAERQRIFDRYFSAPRGDRVARGSGLGLTIARGMIGAHGGEVEALPGPAGTGTVLRLTLPVTEPPRAGASPREEGDEA